MIGKCVDTSLRLCCVWRKTLMVWSDVHRHGCKWYDDKYSELLVIECNTPLFTPTFPLCTLAHLQHVLSNCTYLQQTFPNLRQICGIRKDTLKMNTDMYHLCWGWIRVHCISRQVINGNCSWPCLHMSDHSIRWVLNSCCTILWYLFWWRSCMNVTSYNKVCQMLSWQTKNWTHSINIWDIVTNLVPLYSVHQAPSYEPSVT